MTKLQYPRWITVHQQLDNKRIDDPYGSIHDQLSELSNRLHFAKGARIAITAGSRFISNIVPITKSVIDYVSSKGAHPFVVPAMGSHGGATDAGQLSVLHEIGLTEEALGVQILSSMEVVQIGVVDDIPVYIDANAYKADGIIVINRIKPHQVFKGEIQSGLNKMLTVGLGKKKGADAIHAAGRIDVLGEIGDFICSRVPVLFGVAILENSYDETRDVAVVSHDQFKDYDSAWVKTSRSIMPRIPIRQLDMVIVDEMGKDISGSGMDTNVIGFTRRLTIAGQPSVPLAVLDLTKKTEGNAMGVGLADFTTKRLVEKINYKKTYINVLATGIYSAGKIPVVFETEQEMLDFIIGKVVRPEAARMIRIKNTLQLDRFLATESLQDELCGNKGIETEGKLIDTIFDKKGEFAF